jgi:hypothetical protein
LVRDERKSNQLKYQIGSPEENKLEMKMKIIKEGKHSFQTSFKTWGRDP